MSNLLVVRGVNVGVKYRLEEMTSIGRGPENTIQIADGQVSRLHCEIRRRGRSFTLFDKGSRNGILVNNRAVREKLLLRNDEIVIGETRFLFNSDYDLKNTRFSNQLVYFSPPQDETAQALQVGDAGSQATLAQGQLAMEALRNMADLFAPSREDFSGALETALKTLMKLFEAERGCLLLWDEALGELQPMVAVSEGEGVALSQRMVQRAFMEKQAILASSADIDYRYAEGTRPADGQARSVMCAPLVVHDKAVGALHLERPRPKAYHLDDIRLLQAAANLAAAAIVEAQRRDAAALVPREEAAPGGIVGASASFRAAMTQVAKVAPFDTSVLLTGETGSGKEVIAREIHRRSPRASRPFIAVNCAAIPETLFESELFGHERGAFTGADRLAIGKIEAAHGGTLFLDEVGEIAPWVQPKLLRFLQEHVFYRVGGSRPVTVNVRILAATNKHLQDAVKAGSFREDLYYRLNVLAIELPPLRERREDVRLLADHFLSKHSRAMNKPVLGFSDEALRTLTNYAWPGNIRELENCLERAVLLCDGKILESQHFNLEAGTRPGRVRGATLEDREDLGDYETAEPSLRDVEEKAVRRALAEARGNQVKAAERLKIHRNTIRKKIQEYGIDVSEFAR